MLNIFMLSYLFIATANAANPETSIQQEFLKSFEQKSTDIKCLLCNEVATQIKEELAKNKTVEVIVNDLDYFCQYFPTDYKNQVNL